MVENTATKTKPAVSNTKEAPVTQNLEETVAIKEAKKKAEEKKQQEADERRKKAEADRVAQQEAAKKGQINNQMAGLFGNGTGSGSRGNTEGTGTQGVPTGNASYGKTSGVGGWGSFDLGGRSLGSGGLIKPNYSVDDYGTVVVDILVNAKGDVVEATIGKGTNTPNTNLRNEALRAAKRTKFNTVSSVTNQKGTITYKFNLN
jgi:TonB family C-terminal domain